MKILTIDHSNNQKIIDTVSQVLQSGGLVVLPSDSVYGLCVDVENERAVKKLIEFKSRPAGKPISIFVGSLELARMYVQIDKQNEKMLNQLLPGPYTIVLPSKHKAVSLLESERGTLGIRIPEHTFVNLLVGEYGKAITATSANLAGRSPHYSVDALLKTLSEKKKSLIDLIVDAGKLAHNPTSTVIDLTEERISVLRQGKLLPDFISVDTFISQSDEETRMIGQEIIKKVLKKYNDDKPVVVLLYGDMGAGKTVLVKGIGAYLGINTIISPTFVIYYEYPCDHLAVRSLIHCDLYKINDSEEFNHLGIEKMVKEKTVMCIEWSEKSEPIKALLKKNAHIVEVSIEYISELKRAISISQNI